MTPKKISVCNGDDVANMMGKVLMPYFARAIKCNHTWRPTQFFVKEIVAATQLMGDRLSTLLGRNFIGFFGDLSRHCAAYEARLTGNSTNVGMIELGDNDDSQAEDETEKSRPQRYDFDAFNLFSRTVTQLVFEKGAQHAFRQQSQVKYEKTAYREIGSYVCQYLEQFAIERPPHPRVVCIGSCFAENLSIALRKTDLEVDHIFLHEQLNYPAFLADVMRSVFDKPLVAHDESFDWLQRDRVRKSLTDADWVVLTLGSNVFVRDGITGRAIVPRIDGHSTSRLPNGEKLINSLRNKAVSLSQCSLQENSRELDAFIGLVREANPRVRILLTLSPVPLAAMYGQPVMEQDCISKSTLRVVIADAVARNPELIYFPSFELVKWLGPHLPMSTFGADDSEPRHVNRGLVNAIVEPVAQWMNSKGREN